MSKHVREILRRGQRGFTLIELVAVMAILAILVAIVAPSVTSSRDASVSAQAQADAKQVNTLAAEFYGNQNEAEVRTPHTTAVNAISIPPLGQPGAVQQFISSRWPELFITVQGTRFDFQRWNVALAEWSSVEAVSGGYSALLTVPAGGLTNAARVTMPAPVAVPTVGHVTDASAQYWLTSDTTSPHSPYIILELDTDGIDNGVGDGFSGSGKRDTWAVSIQDDGVGKGSWITHDTTKWHIATTIAGASYGCTSQDKATACSLSQLKAQVGGASILRVKVAIGEWGATGRTSAYVDDIKINGTVYPLGPNTGLGAYPVEFEPTVSPSKVVKVTLFDTDNKTVVSAEEFLRFTAVDFVKLGGDTPSSATLTSSVVGISVHNFLWLFEKDTSKAGLPNDIRRAAVFQLTGTEINESLGTVNLTYKRVL